MTHPSPRSKPRARNAPADPKRYHLTPTGLAWLEQRLRDRARVATCVYCGCTDERPCPGGCYWVTLSRRTRLGICSNCESKKRGDATHDDDVAAKNRQAFAALRALHNALLAVDQLKTPDNSNQ